MSETPIPLADVLLPLAIDGPYSYRVPDGMVLAPGDYVQVPLGPREYIGVVWERRDTFGTNLKLRDVSQKFEMTPMTAMHRKFIQWLSAYYLEPMGAVLRMVLRVPSAFEPERQRMAYVLGDVQPTKLTPQRARILEIAREGFAMSSAELAQATGVGQSVVKALAAMGALKVSPVPAHAAFPELRLNAATKTLSAAQRQAAAKLRASIASRQHKVTLLDGVTGSGKTEVYFEAMAAALAGGGQVLLLLPEIALTGGFLARVEQRFGCEPAGWHSDLRPRERERVWRGVAEGRARIVVGARSALFLPWKNLQLIVVDEEHEGAYKQSDGVTYHARDMAVLYGTLGKFCVVLASATPSLESMVNVDRQKYDVVKLDDRHGRPELPEIKLLDMRVERLPATQWLSEPMIAEVKRTLESGDQALLFLNRRGYAPLTLCRACGYRVDCPHCAASLVEHRFRGILMCHHCGHQQPNPKACPKCGSEEKMVPVGPGVERLAEEVQQLFPEARMTILSSDLARGQVLRDVIREVEDGTHNLVIGTQLVAKGHHFPHLTFVGVIDADLALESSDPRAGERTWAMLAQVAGRAGRGEKPGRALVQTYAPDHPLMKALTKGDREAYFAQEKIIRESAKLPPYGRLAAIILSGNDASEVERFSRNLAQIIPPTDDIEVLGPAQAPIAIIRGRHRWRFLVKAGREKDIQGFLRKWLGEVKPKGSLSLQIDVDPYGFL
jgi:primosomal protein N' (replication factor Y) (superfamily II helicase)